MGNGFVLNNEVVQVLKTKGEWAKVHTSLADITGYIRSSFLKECPEGRSAKGKLSGDRDPSGVSRKELKPDHPRFQMLNSLLKRTQCHEPLCRCINYKIEARRIW